MIAREIGMVKWFDNSKGYGFIVSAEGVEVFAHYRDIVGEGYRSLKEGQAVSYIAVEGDKGLKASEVKSE